MRTDCEVLPRHQLRPGSRLASSDNWGALLRTRATSSDDWRALLRTRANVLVTGPEEALTAFAQTARSEMREPVRWVASSTPLFFDAARTLILAEVDALDDAGQQRLMRWLNERRNTDTQIISLTSVPLFSLVGTNSFDADLYYRLNTIHLKIRDA